jgi:hypothetical protein
MRPDMKYVVIEAPRSGGLTKGRPNLPRDEEALDALPRTAAIYDRQRHHERKTQNDVLNPLRRWLATQVGRPWSKVYSDFCAHADANSLTGFHIKSHLFQYVDTHCRVENGVVVHNAGSRFGGGSHSDFWVDPRNDLLRRNGRLPYRWKPTWPYDYEPVLVDRHTQLHKERGVWWFVRLEPWVPILLPRLSSWSGASAHPHADLTETDSLGTTYAQASKRYGRALGRSPSGRSPYRRARWITPLPELVTLRAVAIRTAARRDKKRWGVV